MTLITIREKTQTDDNTYEAELSFDHGMPYPITIKNPFSAKQEKLFEWYFEKYSKFPFTKQVEFAQAAASVPRYGEELFEQVFSHRKVYAEYSHALQTTDLEIEIVGLSTFHQLHWEALKDPDSDHALALHHPIIRKPVGHPPPMVTGQASPTLNVLLVIARPDGKDDIGYRTISRPLVEMLQNAKLPVKIDILRPGTYQALTEQLEQVTSQQGKGYYHLIHFDVHGAVLDYETLQQGHATDQFSYQTRFGRADLGKFAGLKAFLFLQGNKTKQSDPVEATELADLLTHHGIPIVMLNACQSAKQVGTASETSLGSRLMQSGAQTVVAMAYSVQVSAAKLFMQTLYAKLFEQAALSLAIRFGRLALFNEKTRRASYNQQIDLEDWLLPVVYQRQSMALPLRELTEAEEIEYWENEALRYEVPDNTPHGFVGRDLDVLEVESRLLSQRNILLIQGMGGTGKTTLLHHLGAWWQTTHFVEKVFYFGYDEKAWHRQQILATLAMALLGESAYKRFQPLSELAQQKMLVKRLRAERHLLILDNLESITGTNLAIQHTLPVDEQQKLQSFLRDLVGGNSLILLGSRGDEAWLADGTFANNVYGLEGLDAEAASQLVDKILAFHGVSRYREDEGQREYLQKLLKLLAGYPLALQVVLGNLVQQTPQKILEALESGSDETLNTGKKTGDSFQDKTTNILRCIDYSYGNLSTDAQRLLLCLAPFTGVIQKYFLPAYTERLKQQSVLANLPFKQWETVLQEAKNWGLLAPHPEIPEYLWLQPIFPYFMRNRLQSQPDYQSAIETAFRCHYDDIGYWMANLLDSKETNQRQIGQIQASLEYENLSKALDLALAEQKSILNSYTALSNYLDITQDHARNLDLSEKIARHFNSYSVANVQESWKTEFASILDTIAQLQYRFKQYTNAEQSYQRALKLVEQFANIDDKSLGIMKANIYHRLGMVAQEQRQWLRARQYYQDALKLKIKSNDRYEQASTYFQLGSLEQEQRQWQKAERYHRKALSIYIKFNDQYGQAEAHNNLGLIAQEQKQWQQAEQCYQKALKIHYEGYEAGKFYLNLGIVKQELQQWQLAEQNYQNALKIFIEFNDRYSQARVYNQLGNTAQKQQQWQQAQQYYQTALEIYNIEYNDYYEVARIYNNLSIITQNLQQWQKAKDYLLKALSLWVEFDDSYNIETLALPNLVVVYRATNDDTLPAEVAKVLGISVEEVLKSFSTADQGIERIGA
ncbi:MAG: tetratricopeptide repeat protein [Candidatus Parabeggiatoa sp.]|nr:tetratricopeptide repeat protein [Candidatus Parabeggiatoa sp.]